VSASSGRPAYLIARDEVASWLADSVVKPVTYHRASRQAANRIRADSADPTRSRVRALGQGFCTATREEQEFGPVRIVAAIRLRNPLTGTFDEVEDAIDRIAFRLNPPRGEITTAVAAGIRRELLRLEYDGIVIPDGGGDGVDWVIALTSEAVKVVDE
jgi:hypothetical protein